MPVDLHAYIADLYDRHAPLALSLSLEVGASCLPTLYLHDALRDAIQDRRWDVVDALAARYLRCRVGRSSTPDAIHLSGTAYSLRWEALVHADGTVDVRGPAALDARWVARDLRSRLCAPMPYPYPIAAEGGRQ